MRSPQLEALPPAPAQQRKPFPSTPQFRLQCSKITLYAHHASKPSTTGTHAAAFVQRWVALDLEVGIKPGRINRLAAGNGQTGHSFSSKKGVADLPHRDAFAAPADFFRGHALINFDLPHLAAAKPDRALLNLPAINTLCLNSLPPPRNLYHHLGKHYPDGQLVHGSINDPELAARLTLDLFAQ